MMYSGAERALSAARKDYERAITALLAAETPAAQKRHARRARTAQTRIREASRDMARLGCDLEAWAA